MEKGKERAKKRKEEEEEEEEDQGIFALESSVIGFLGLWYGD